MKSIGELHDALREPVHVPANTRDGFEVIHTVLHELLEHIDSLNSNVAFSDQEHVVPAQWYRSAVHNHMKAYIELLALAVAINNVAPQSSVDIIAAQRKTLTEDSDYQRLLAEEQPMLIPEPPIWGKGLEELIEVQKRYSACLAAEPNVDYADARRCTYRNRHGGKHSWEGTCPKCNYNHHATSGCMGPSGTIG